MPTARARRPAAHLRVNRALWDRISGSYERAHAPALRGAKAMAWGLWRLPERRLALLGPVRGRRVLDLGCGAGRWPVALRARGARAVGVDFSTARLAQARTNERPGRRGVGWVRGDAERLPFRPGAFDLVLSDWGAMTFADPRRTVPEVARVLRRGGRLVFATAHPIRSVAEAPARATLGRSLRRAYFELGRLEFPHEVNFQLPLGGWIDLFAAHGLTVDRLLEPRPGARDRSSYLRPRQERWARSWPLEAIWCLSKRR